MQYLAKRSASKNINQGLMSSTTNYLLLTVSSTNLTRQNKQSKTFSEHVNIIITLIIRPIYFGPDYCFRHFLTNFDKKIHSPVKQEIFIDFCSIFIRRN